MFYSHLVLILCLGVFPLAVMASILPTFADIVRASTRLDGKTIVTPGMVQTYTVLTHTYIYPYIHIPIHTYTHTYIYPYIYSYI